MRLGDDLQVMFTYYVPKLAQMAWHRSRCCAAGNQFKWTCRCGPGERRRDSVSRWRVSRDLILARWCLPRPTPAGIGHLCRLSLADVSVGQEKSAGHAAPTTGRLSSGEELVLVPSHFSFFAPADQGIRFAGENSRGGIRERTCR